MSFKLGIKGVVSVSPVILGGFRELVMAPLGEPTTLCSVLRIGFSLKSCCGSFGVFRSTKVFCLHGNFFHILKNMLLPLTKEHLSIIFISHGFWVPVLKYFQGLGRHYFISSHVNFEYIISCKFIWRFWLGILILYISFSNGKGNKKWREGRKREGKWME